MVDPRDYRESRWRGDLADESFGVLGIGVEKDDSALFSDRFGPAVVHVGWGMKSNTGMTMIVVIPSEKSGTVGVGVFETADSFKLIPPFYADYGLNITIGRAVFIGYQCMFTGHGAIDIADEVMIANKVNLVTAGHPVEPDKRRAYITVEPITVETNVWIGSAATVLPGVTIGADSVVAAGAVVAHDVPPATLVAGVPATVIKHL